MDDLQRAIDALEPGQRIITANLTPEQYHARPEISSGFIRSLIARGEWTTYHEYISKSISRPDSDAMRLGRLFHAAAPDPQTVMDRVAVIPSTLQTNATLAAVRKKWLGRTKASLEPGMPIDRHVPAHREYLDAMTREAVASGKQWCSDEELSLQIDQINSVLSNPQTADCFGNANARYEIVGFYRDPATHLVLKGMADVVLGDLIVDFKTTRHHTREQFAREALRTDKRLDLQCAHYCRVFGKQQAAIVAVRNFQPVEAMFYSLSAYHLQQADLGLSIALDKIKQCIDMGTWHSEGWGQVNSLATSGD